jgi:putative oxidoreductase
MKQLLKYREKGIFILRKLSWLPPLIARITLAGVFIESGWGKLNNIPKVVEFFTSLGLPLPGLQAHLVAFTEFSCGICLLLGFFTKLASIPLTIVMIVAVITAKLAEIHSVTDLFSVAEYLNIVILLWLIISGPGSASFDSLLIRRLNLNGAEHL